MAVAVANELLVPDGDAAFVRVNNRVPAHALPPGEVAAATNIRFEQGKPGPRFGVALDDWGRPGTNLARGFNWTVQPGDTLSAYAAITGLTVGQTYELTFIQAWAFSTAAVIGEYAHPSGTMVATAEAIAEAADFTAATESGQTYIFTATATSIYIWAPVGTSGAVQAWLRVNDSLQSCAYKRFNDPVTETDNGILLTDEWRTTGDGGRGRAWRIIPGNVPQEISLNGHDVWGTARLVQCREGMMLLRHGNERHYFVPADLDGTDNEIDLHCAPSWAVGTSKRVRFNYATDGAFIDGTTPPASGNYYYARHFASDVIKLYQSSSDAAADTNELDFTVTGALGKFFIELAEAPAPFFGNGAPVLLMETSEIGQTAFEVGFEAVRSNITITNTTASTVECPNHHFRPGDSVTQTGITVGTGANPYYAFPIDADTISLHSTAEAALTGASAISTITPAGTGSIKKTNASGLPLPPCREGAYIGGRFWGINERDTIVHSDVNDFLHFTQYESTVPANQGEAGRANWILPLGEDALVIGKDLKLIVLVGISGATSGWQESTITSEYGGIAALAATPVGTNLWCLSRKGVARAIRTTSGEKLAAADTVSRDIPRDLLNVDWHHAFRACSETWNGRYFLGVPAKGQDQDSVVNNHVLVLNFNNANLRVQQGELAGDIVGGLVETGGETLSWEGSWNGELLTPYAFAVLTVNGEERLTFATPDGLVCWLHDGWDDAGTPIESELLTRGYFGGREMLTLKGKLNWDSFNPLVTVSIVTAGVNEETTLAGFDELQYDRTKYLTSGQPDYDPSTSTAEQFSAPDREDYSPTAEELLVATLDTHQNLTEPLRCRERGVAPQLRITNAQGSLRVCSVSLQARPVGVAATRKT